MYKKILSNLFMREKCVVFSVNRFVGRDRGVVGGLSDRLQGLLFTYLLAKLTDRKFYIDWDKPFNIRDIFEPANINWDMSGLDFFYNKTVDLIDGNFSDDKKALVSRGRSGIEKLFGNAKIVKVYCNSMPIECFSNSILDNENLKDSLDSQKTFFYTFFKDLFVYTIPSELEKKFSKFVEQRKLFGYMVGLQFRTGGGGRWSDPNVDSLDNVDGLLKAMKKLLLKRGVNKYSVFLTTDNNDVKSIVKKKLEGISEVIIFDEDPVHIDRSDFDVAKKGAVQTCFEHYLLGQCDLIICGKGGFGTTAAFRENKNAFRYFNVRD